jgi:uncharacterized Zn finger protein
MIGLLTSGPRVVDVDCTIDIECTIDSFHAHVELDNDMEIRPGDKVLVHGSEISVPYGERRTERRRATVIRANALEQAWTRLTAALEFTELYDLSFTDRRDL